MKRNVGGLAAKSKRLKFADGGAVDDGDVVGMLRRGAEESRRVMSAPAPRWQQIQEERARQAAEYAAGVTNPQVYRRPTSPPVPIESLTDNAIRRYLAALEAEQGTVGPRLNVGRPTIPASSPYTARDLRLELARRQPASPRRAPFEGEPGYSEPTPALRPSARPAAAAVPPAAAARMRTSDAASQPAMPPPAQRRTPEAPAEQPRPREEAPPRRTEPAPQAERPRQQAPRRRQPQGESEADRLNAISQAFIRGERPRGGAADVIGKAMGIEGYKKGGLIGKRKAAVKKMAAKPVKKAAGGAIQKPKVPGRPAGRPAQNLVKPMGTRGAAKAVKPMKPVAMPAFKKGGKVAAKKRK